MHQASADVVLGFIGRTGRHPPNDDPDSIAGVAGWALSLHASKLLKVTDKNQSVPLDVQLKMTRQQEYLKL
jgi:hypothetical protein